MMLFDSHAHINNEDLTPETREALAEAIGNSQLDYVMDIGFDLASSKLAADHAAKYPWCYAAVGCHPHDAKDMDFMQLAMIKGLAKKDKVVAIGEIGLDFHYDHSPRELQRYWFRKQIQLANELKLPIVIHSREADQEVMDILKEEGAFSDERKSRFAQRPDPTGYIGSKGAAGSNHEKAAAIVDGQKKLQALDSGGKSREDTFGSTTDVRIGCGKEYRIEDRIDKDFYAPAGQKELGSPDVYGSKMHNMKTSDSIGSLCDDARVLLHCFSGSSELAKQYVKLGATISIAGPVTYKNNRKTIAVVEEIPIDFLLVETDSPYLTPEPFRGKKNTPLMVEHTARKIAEIKGMTFDDVAAATKVNAMRFYGI